MAILVAESMQTWTIPLHVLDNGNGAIGLELSSLILMRYIKNGRVHSMIHCKLSAFRVTTWTTHLMICEVEMCQNPRHFTYASSLEIVNLVRQTTYASEHFSRCGQKCLVQRIIGAINS